MVRNDMRGAMSPSGRWMDWSCGMRWPAATLSSLRSVSWFLLPFPDCEWLTDIFGAVAAKRPRSKSTVDSLWGSEVSRVLFASLGKKLHYNDPVGLAMVMWASQTWIPLENVGGIPIGNSEKCFWDSPQTVHCLRSIPGISRCSTRTDVWLLQVISNRKT